MKRKRLLNSILLLLCVVCFSFKPTGDPAFTDTDIITFGGKSIAFDITDCSTDNSSNGKNRGMTAMNTSTASSCTIQFVVVSPASGTFLTGEDGDTLKPGEVLLGVAGDDYDGNFIAKKGQPIIVTNNGGKYRASFKELSMTNEGKDSTEKLSGNFGCK